ncbi:MAG: hypothetical protein IJ562_02905 [Prevotella sp.]|nr:hypothetical protein [Prevotella sp.]
MKRIFCAIVSMAIALTTSAQSGTNSPYSQYGLGVLSDQTSGFNRGMNGLGLGFRQGNQVNFINPASYSSIDSLTFIFDAGVSGQITNFNENGVKKNAKNADFEYVVAGFRLRKHVGVSFGILPFTNVGYSFSSTGTLNEDRTVIYSNTYSGDGGVHQAYLGMGWEPVRNFSIGANFAYLWGNYERKVTNAYSETTAKTLDKVYNLSVNDYRLDFGAQYSLKLNKKNMVTVGATFSPGHRMSADPECLIISSVSSLKDTTAYSVKDGVELPTMISAGFVFDHNNQLKLGVDYSLQKWGSTSFPVYGVENNAPVYKLSYDYFMDRHKITLGGEYCKGGMMRRFLDRIHYRAGVSYATPYVKINGMDGPKELSVSAGFGIPIMNGYNNRSFLNISGQWVHQGGKGMITENTFRINIGMTFNERWFKKWQVD